ncbi:tetratricopeptide repeat protein [Flavobacterium agricola]|uniref:Tetratricopeptide repeat protein n=1 Tax=Flavobacterium agricola TaxID=2870839 RepID=A0ABY6LZK5_9FLAO|nr:tetratricopeptide repeat protein [Flavobacterium agricola]UYW00885.1 tetratricopeptide repeat protein [Flavobacterium agricola]
MMQVKSRFIVFYFLLSGFVATAQIPGENVADEIENNFYEAISQKAIENYDKAIVLLQKNVQKQPENAVFYNQLGKNYFALKDYYQAELAYEKAISLSANQKWYWIDLYKLFYTTKDFKKAIPIAVKIAEMDPEYTDDLVSLYVYAKEYDKALVLLDELEKRGKLSPAMQRFKFQAESELKFTKKVKADFKQATQINPADETAYEELITNYLHDEDYDKTYQTINQLVQHVPNSDWGHVTQFRSALQANNYATALQHLNAAITSNTVHELLKHRIFNEYLIFVNANPKYETDLVSVVDLFKNQDIINVPKEVGVFFYNKNKFNVAQVYLEKGLQNNPNDVVLQTLLIQNFLANKNYAQAAIATKKYIELYPAEAKLYYYLGIAQVNSNEPKKALQSFDEALTYLFDDDALEANIYIQMGECYHKLGNEKQKETYFIKANKILNP